MLVSIAVSIAVLILLVRFWPVAPPEASEPPVYRVAEDEVIRIDEIRQTSQAVQAPPPPAPLPPVVMPDEVILEQEFDISDSFVPVDIPASDIAPPSEGPPGPPAGTTVTEPKPVRFVEPEYTREARRKRVRAEVVVEVVIDERGRVQEAKVVERFLLGDEATAPQPVTSVGYGLEEAALAAAERWIFRPARRGGEAVRSSTMLTFRFGV